MQGGPFRSSVKTCCLGEGEEEKIPEDVLS